jgi:hypothetical protein
MTTAQILGMTDVSWRARWERRRRVIVPVIAALIAIGVPIGAFLTFGPIGLGNGPLSVLNGGGVTFMTDAGPGPVAITVLMGNSSRDRPVIDALELIGGTRYVTPRILGLNVEIEQPQCASVGPARLAGHRFVSDGCGDRDRGPLIGRSIGAHSEGFLGAAEIAAPRPGTCWVMTKVVIHYHVGYRHYAATDPYRLTVCAKGTPSAQFNAAVNAADD